LIDKREYIFNKVKQRKYMHLGGVHFRERN